MSIYLFNLKVRHYIIIRSIFLLILHSSINLIAQNIVVKNYGVNNGLPSSECYCVMQDSRHYLWIATDAGVVKYDGYKFISYNSNKGLPDNTVFKIHEDNYGKIWFSTYSGKLAYYSYTTDSVYSIPANDKLIKDVKVFPTDFCFDNKDTLWLSMQLDGYVKIIPPLYKKFIKYSIPEVNYFIKEVSGNRFIYGVDCRAKPVDSISFCFGTLNYGFIKKPYNKKTVAYAGRISATKLNSNTYLFSNGNALFKVSNEKVEELIHIRSQHANNINSVSKDSKGNVWLSTSSNGVLLFDNFSLNHEPKKFLQNDIVTSAFEDIDHGYWFTTTNNGLNYIPALNFNYYNTSCGLSSNKVYAFTILNDKLYCVVSDSKLNILDLKTKKITIKTNCLYTNASITSHDNLLIYNSPASTQIENTSLNKIIPVESPFKGVLHLKKIIGYNQDSILGCSLYDLFLINKRNGGTTLRYTLPSRISCIYLHKKQIFVGTKQGLYKIENNRTIYLADSTPALGNRIEDITSIGDHLFIATKGVGVICYKNGKILHQFNEANGLASNICKCIIKGNEKNIWVGTNRGISHIKLNNEGGFVCNTINLSNGLISNEINQLMEYKQQLFFGTNNGIGSFYIKDAFDKQKNIPIYIENFLINNKKFDHAKAYRLNYNQNFIKIHYKGVYLKNEGDITYKYKLEGLDTNWTYSKNTFVQYTTLPSGNYKFIVFAINSNNVLSSTPAVIKFCINKPFWKTWWFIGSMTCLFFLLAFLLYQNRVYQIGQREKQKTIFNTQLAESELRALRAQMNPHFIFNAINSIQNFVLKNDSRSAHKYLTKFARLIRSVLENSKHELVLLSSEIESLELYIELELLRASFSFDYEIILTNELNADHYRIPPMILQPYVENAILHGLLPLQERRGKLTITFSKKDKNILHCIIDDNGIGREKAMDIKTKKELSRKSLGMEVTQERIEILNSQNKLFTSVNVIDKIENNKPVGTSIEISIEI